MHKICEATFTSSGRCPSYILLPFQGAAVGGGGEDRLPRALPWAMFFCPFGAMFPFGELSFGFMGCGNWNFFFLGPLPLIFQTPKHSLLPPPHIVQNTLSHKTPHFPLTTKKKQSDDISSPDCREINHQTHLSTNQRKTILSVF